MLLIVDWFNYQGCLWLTGSITKKANRRLSLNGLMTKKANRLLPVESWTYQANSLTKLATVADIWIPTLNIIVDDMIDSILVDNQAYLRDCILNTGDGNTSKLEIKKILWDFTSALSVSGRDTVLHTWTLLSFLLHRSNCRSSRGEEAQSTRSPRLRYHFTINYI